MMDTDDLEPRPRPHGAPELETMSVEALHEYIAGLEQEITRARAAIQSKGMARAAAEGFFKANP